VATVSVVLEEADRYTIRSRLASAYDVRSPDGAPLALMSVESACISGAAFACRFCEVGSRRVVVASAQGCSSEREVDGFAIAASIAVARALGSEELLPTGDLDDWVPD